MKCEFDGRHAVVTGAARGIGLNIALVLARAGTGVMIADLDQDRGLNAKKEVEACGVAAHFLKIDLTHREAPQRMVREAIARFGKIDILVNNARAGERLGMTEEHEENWDRTLAVCLKAAFFATQEASCHMSRTGGGCVVNVASVSAFLVSEESPAYHIAKAGLVQLTRFCAVAGAAHGVRVNAVVPGFIVQDEHRERFNREDNAEYRRLASAVHPGGEVGRADHVAEAVKFLCSNAASFINGHALFVDGALSVQDPWKVLYSFSCRESER